MIIEIALGIVLAVIILVCLPMIIVAVLWISAIAIVIITIGIGIFAIVTWPQQSLLFGGVIALIVSYAWLLEWWKTPETKQRLKERWMKIRSRA